jgi:spermidine synthase
VLIASALIFGGLFGRRGRAAAMLVLFAGAAYAGLWPGALPPPYQDPLLQPSDTGQIHFEESQYYTIAVERTIREDTGAPMHALHLDHLVHSYADLDDPTHLEYGYLRTFNEVIDWTAKQRPVFRLLFIGGGGYTLPRLVDSLYPTAQVDVVEIDPAVTRAARRFFGVERDAAIRSVNEDARWFAMEAARHATGEPYDVIFIDAFNDLSVPYHLTTREFTAGLRQLLTPNGALVVNVIDDYRKGRFLASYTRTLQSVFGGRNVSVLMDAAEDMESSRSTFVVLAAPQAGSIAAESAAYALPAAELQRYLASRKALVLTDDFAPVDNMLAPLFAERFVDELQDE